MQPLEKLTPMDDAPEDKLDVQDSVSQLAFAYKRSEAALTGSDDEVLAEAIRRAEAILFAAGEPLSAEQISEVLPQQAEAATVLMALKASYAGRGVELVEVAGKWRFQTSTDLAFLFVEERQVQKKLSQAALETLAIIAYGQPVTRAEVEAVRGVAVSKGILDTLLETSWIKTKGQRQTPGLPMQYGTTDAFLEHFGLESLDTLPGKADLEAEGLLSDVIPDAFSMPGEEGLSEDDIAIEAEAVIEDSSFVTDFMDDEDEGEAEVEATTDSGVEEETEIEADVETFTPEMPDGFLDAFTGPEGPDDADVDYDVADAVEDADTDVTHDADDTVTPLYADAEAVEIAPVEDDVASAVMALAQATRGVVSPTAGQGTTLEPVKTSDDDDDEFDDEKPDWDAW